jgi:hypothetical protein
MPEWMPLSRFGAVLAVLYLVFAIWVLVTERTTQAGGWINLNGMATYLVTFPVSLPLEAIGMRPDYKKTLDMVLTIGSCTVLVYFIGAGASAMVRFLFAASKS